MAGSESLAEAAAPLRAKGDRLRDSKRWAEAAVSYASYLDEIPDDWPIWVQHGHCLKEQGDTKGGLASYHRALELAPADSDLHLQIGHALKLLGHTDEALAAYRQALFCDAGNENARREIEALEIALTSAEAEHTSKAQSRATRLMFDISDLVQYMREWRVPSGIQRIQLNIIYFTLTDFATAAKPLIVCFHQGRNEWIQVDETCFLALHKAAESGDEILEEDLLHILRELDNADLREEYLDLELRGSDVILVNLGTSWWVENYFLKIRDLRKKHGIRYVPMIHDVIPLTTPEHCSQRLVEEFCQWFSTLAFEVDGAVTNSHWSALDVRHYVSELMPEAVFPIQPIALNGDMRRDFSTRAVSSKDIIAHLLPPGASFVLSVGTLESRKNHLLLFKAWERLLEKHGAAELPILVCLGKAGWLFDEAAEFLRARTALSTRVILVSSVTDQCLAALYEEGLFTIFNSFYEGWGLPVTESLSFGALPLIACNTSLTEAGGRSAVYFRSDDLDDLYGKLEALILNPHERKRLTGHARANARLRDWKDVSGDFVAKILSVTASADTRQERLLRVPIGRSVHFGKSNALTPSIDLAMANLLRDGLNWHRLEEWGTWTTPGIATIRLPLPDEAIGQELMLFLRLRGTAVDTSITVSCRVDDHCLGSPIERMIGHGERHSMVFRLQAVTRQLSVTIDAGMGSSLGPGDRDVGIGITHLMLCHASDTAAQDHFLNTFPELRQEIGHRAHVTLQRTDVKLGHPPC